MKLAIQGIVLTIALAQAACCSAQPAPGEPAAPTPPAPAPAKPPAPPTASSGGGSGGFGSASGVNKSTAGTTIRTADGDVLIQTKDGSNPWGLAAGPDGRKMYFNFRGRTKTEPGPYLGITAVPVTPALRTQLKLQPGVGLTVEHIDKDSPAASAGVEQYDILQKLDEQILIDTQQFGVLVRMLKPGEETRLTLLRNGQSKTITVKPIEKQVPALDGPQGLLLRSGGGTFELPIEELAIEESREGMRKAMDEMRKARGDASVMRYADKNMTLEITRKNDKRQLVARDADGKTLFEGPINTEEERKPIPSGVARRLREMEGTADEKK